MKRIFKEYTSPENLYCLHPLNLKNKETLMCKGVKIINTASFLKSQNYYIKIGLKIFSTNKVFFDSGKKLNCASSS